MKAIQDAWLDRYNEEYTHGEYCHETSFKWGFEEGANYVLEELKRTLCVSEEGWVKSNIEKLIKEIE